MVFTKEAAKVAAEAYIPVSLKTLRIDTVLDFDLYIKINGEYILYRANETAFSGHSLKALMEHNVPNIFVSSTDCGGYQKYIEQHLEDILRDDSVDDSSKATIMYDTAQLLVKDVMTKPSSVESIKRSMKLVETTVLHNLKNSSAFHNMLKVMQFDYSTYTHSINVCTFSLALAQAAGISDHEELSRLGLGALLHDVGKTRIDESILNKKGSLSPEEWKLIEKHPQWGFEIILETDILPHEA
ncbi:MAG: HD domain-containing protein, partial [candidate division Zixibacteria bacterium]|nr:HD domain-containing protein [candidate division Zixibacteria bacterium]